MASRSPRPRPSGDSELPRGRPRRKVCIRWRCARRTKNGVTVSSTTRVLVASNLPPAGIGGVQIWLKATRGIIANTDGLVTAWQDQSGLGNNAAQGNVSVAPKIQENVFGNLPGITFANNSVLTGDDRHADGQLHEDHPPSGE